MMIVKERERLMFLGLRRKPTKPPHQACSVHDSLRRPLDGVKVQSAFSRGVRSPGRKVNSESLCAPGDQTERERERERERGREKARHRDQSSDGAKVF